MTRLAIFFVNHKHKLRYDTAPLQPLGTVQGVVHASVGQKVTLLASSQGYVAVHFLHTVTPTDESTNDLPNTITMVAEPLAPPGALI